MIMQMRTGRLIKALLGTVAIAAFPGVTMAAENAPDRRVLPLPAPGFSGTVGRDFTTSKQDYPQPIKAPKGAPNVVLILLDDIGFGQPGTFGGPVPTPNMDRLAKAGLRYNRFHTTGVCSPTRAALLTGRNHHQTGNGTITELSTGFPGYHSVWPKSVAAIPEILKANGYNTAAWGKWHNTPDWETSRTGPFDRWPTGLGFETWYGFHGGETSQWEPQLYRDQTSVEPGLTPAQGYNLNHDLANDAINWVNTQQAVAPDKPFFIYFAPGGAHAPLHAPKDWIVKFKGQFDQGWDKVREETLARQISMGLVPKGTKLTPRPKEIAAWNTLSPDAKRLFARHQEVFAAYLAQTDHEVGRLLDAVEKLPDADNTMIVYVIGDNGPSAEGSLTGTVNNMMTQNGIPDTVEAQLPYIDEIGGPKHENHYPVGWSWAGSSPFQWMKRVPSHFGGTRNGMIVAWPSGINDAGGLRSQFAHVVDVAPTIFAAANIPMPTSVNGVEQVPLAGVPITTSFASAAAPSLRTRQYFETGGHRAIYDQGWVATAFHGVPWELAGSAGNFDKDVWQLYNIESDFSQAVDLAASNPAKLKSMQVIFDEEAKKYNVFPLDDRFAARGSNPERPSVTRGRTSFTYGAGATRIPEGSAPPVYQRSHSITAELEIPKGGADGVIIAEGGGSGGYSLFVKDGRLHYESNFFTKGRTLLTAPDALPEGKTVVMMTYVQGDKANSGGGVASLSINGTKVAEKPIAQVVANRFSATETLDIGMDLGSAVSDRYHDRAPFPFTGRIDKVVVGLEPVVGR
jgi:arylsulfatase